MGRVCCDSEGRINERSALLEGSARDSLGARVRMDLSQLGEFRIFPGQIVAVRGRNPSGKLLVASEIRGELPLPQAASSIAELEQHVKAMGA